MGARARARLIELISPLAFWAVHVGRVQRQAPGQLSKVCEGPPSDCPQ
jgi:hypothetical protein